MPVPGELTSGHSVIRAMIARHWMPPPWIKYPDITLAMRPGPLDWRLYVVDWERFIHSLTDAERDEYRSLFPPPIEWHDIDRSSLDIGPSDED